MEIIDAHLHLFDLNQGDYHWLSAESPPLWPDKAKINKNFQESDLNLSPLTLTGFVHIEAGFDNQQPWREIAWLEQHCQQPFKAVAFIDLLLSNDLFEQHLQQLLSFESVVGCRYILDEQAAELLNSSQVQLNLAKIARHQLTFDVQMPLTDNDAVQALIAVLEKTPTLTVIIDHAGWPPYISSALLLAKLPDAAPANLADTLNKSLDKISDKHIDKSLANWQNYLAGLKALSDFNQVAIKCSGWEMSDRHYSVQWMSTVIDECIASFGINRVLLASNFPLCLFSQDYLTLWQSYLNLDVSKRALNLLVKDNALHWYRFKE